jgi:hypothetical protein
MSQGIEPQRAENWGHLQDLLFEESWNADLGRFRSPCAFRGVGSDQYPQETSLRRLGGPYPRLEHHLLRNFKKYAHRDVVERDSLWHWLAMAQHHGLPTRCLDWSYSPLVAMHFATARLDMMKTDGAVWVINYEQAHQRIPRPLREELRNEGANAFTPEILSRAVTTLLELDGLSDDVFLIMFEPPSIDDRIVNQYALFSMLSSATATLDLWAEQNADICRKVIIPADFKWEVRDKLDQANITERVLFPGLDGLTAWLRRHYSPKDGHHAGPLDDPGQHSTAPQPG